MECPFELPVEANVSVVDSDRRYITGTNGFPFIFGDADKEAADYIVQAINSYEKYEKYKKVVQDLVTCATKYPDDYATKDLNKLIPFVIKEAKQALKEKP